MSHCPLMWDGGKSVGVQVVNRLGSRGKVFGNGSTARIYE